MAGRAGALPAGRRAVSARVVLAFVAVAVTLAACGSSATPLPTGESGLTRLGQAQQAGHHVDAAETDYRSALADDPSYVPALLGLAQLAARAVPVESVALLDQAVAIAPDDAAVHRLLGQVLISMGETLAGREQLRIAQHLERGAHG
jgi:Tfp pilus assembly protein PilF